jgi:DNA mismatch repair protein MutL
MACKSAIKANHSLEMPEMAELINEIYKEDAFRCPHGRPVMQQIGLEEIEKGFGRR